MCARALTYGLQHLHTDIGLCVSARLSESGQEQDFETLFVPNRGVAFAAAD